MHNKSKKQRSDVHEFEAGDYPGDLEFQPEKYHEYLDETDWSDKVKDEWLYTLWNMMNTFVDIGCGLDPVQTAMPSLGKLYAESKGKTAEAKKMSRRRNRVKIHAADPTRATEQPRDPAGEKQKVGKTALQPGSARSHF